MIATLRRDWRMERNSWAIRVLAMLGSMTLLAIILSWMVHSIVVTFGPEENITTDIAENAALSFLCYFMYSVFTCLGASLFYTGYATHGQRINQLMNPASTLEKYISRFIICIVGVSVASAVCWETADWIRMAVAKLYFNGPVAEHVNLFEAFGVVSQRMDSVWFSAIGIISSQGIYTLGSTLWPKNSFLKTMGAMCIVEFIYGFAVGFTSSWFFDFDRKISNTVDMQPYDVIWFMSAIMIAVMFFCYITAYFRMREDETIQRM